MTLRVGVPTEIKADEFRVALTPDGVRELNMHGVEVLVQAGAGAGSSLPDEDYRRAGAEIVDSPDEVWERADLVCKVKEPLSSEFGYFRDDLMLFTYLHLAAYPGVAEALLAAGTTGIAYETVQLADGALPLLAPMSEVAGRMSVQIGAHFLERHNGGRGVLLGGAPGVRPARVVVLGAGNVGWNAAWMAAGPRGRGRPARQERRAPPLHRPDPDGPHHDPGVQPRHGRAGRVRGRPGHRGGARPGRPGAGGGHRRDGGDHEAGLGGGRHRHRPGRLHRDVARDHPQGSRVREARRAPLRRRQHAGRGARTPRPTPSPTSRCRTSPSWPASGSSRPCGPTPRWRSA